MSYEGYTQNICEKGHLIIQDAMDNNEKCMICGSRYVWTNNVDDTNGDASGHVDMTPFEIRTPDVITKEVDGVWQTIHTHGVYRVPPPDVERTYIDDAGHVLILPKDSDNEG